MTGRADNEPSEGPVSEPTLMRFVDGDLPAREHAFVAEIVASHPHATRSVRAYRFTRDRLAEALAPALEVPPELLRRCLPATAPVPFRSKRALLPLMWDRRVGGVALAASIAILLAGASGWLLRGAWQADFAGLDRGLSAPPSLQNALEETPSAGVAQLARSVSLKPMLTFLSIENEYCRQYRLIYGAQVESTGLACRTADGTWRIDVQAAPRAHRALSNTTVPAGEEEDAVANYRDRIMGSRPVLTKDSEERLIFEEHWRRPRP